MQINTRPTYGDTGNLLNPPAPDKQASLVFHRRPEEGWTEQQVSELYRRGFAFTDKRAAEETSTAFVKAPMDEALTTDAGVGLRTVKGLDGKTCKALWGPEIHGYHVGDGIRPDKGARFFDLEFNGRVVCRDVGRNTLLCKMARDLRLPAERAVEIYDLAAKTGKPVTFGLIGPNNLRKLASAWFDRDLREEDFDEDMDYEEDLDVPVDLAERDMLTALLMRSQETSPERRYLDARGYGGPRNAPHGGQDFTVPDEVLLGMRNPMQELTQIAEATGQETLMDHGAIGSLIKVHSAGPFILDYARKLEGSLDYLGRLLFMLYWKPKEFAEMFGSDDLPQLENKITGVFLSYGELVLELLQSAGDKIRK